MLNFTTTGGGGPKPALRTLGEGRLVILIPKREQTGKKYQSEEPKQEIVCDLVVLPDPTRPAAPIIFGGKARLDGTMEEPDTHRVDIGPQGWFCEGVTIGSGGMVSTLRRVMENRQALVGRLWRDHSKEARGAWKVGGEGHEATPAELEIATAWSNAFFGPPGSFTNSAVVPLAGIPAQLPPGVPAYGAPQAQQSPVWNAMEQGYAGAADARVAPQYQMHASVAAGQAMPQQPAYAAPQGYPQAQAPQYAPQQPPAYPVQQQPAYAPQGYPATPVPQSAPPAAPQVPAGVDPETWGRWTPEQRQGFLMHAQQQAQQYAPQEPAPQYAAAPAGPPQTYPGVGSY